MLSLYEASHMMIHGEDILEDALSFTSTHLESIATQLSPFLAAQVKYSLRQALHKNLPRLESRRYISIYEQDPSHDEILLTLAKLDFNLLQSLHQKEFGNISKWDISIIDNLPDYMKILYKSFLTVYEEIEQEMSKEGRIYTLTYYKKEV
ncbi:hypothetical protein TSUD_128670 [Trifolium subterraneum]|uniref:Terpene synthase N-terminal domain-containing protein n=1 Tax=Trifolium subterraneum TaxID=3900 RepID=A0A2Z6MEC6_TRISU|nr:hypothetical protein TSUD_128670 [Trifolium subterraneum]